MDKRIERELSKDNFIQQKKEWRDFCANHATIPLYFLDWYWDANCKTPEDWQVIICKRDDSIIGAFPFCYSIRKGLFFIENPWQVARGGVWIDMNESVSIEKRQRNYSEIINYIISKLPRYDFLNIRMDTLFDNWSSFYWNRFEAIPQYTYTICNKECIGLKNTFSKKRRQRINTALKKYEVRINSITVDEYWDFFKETYDAKKEEISFTKEMFQKLISVLIEHNAIQIRSAYDKEHIVAVQIVFMDSGRMYYHFCTQLQDTMDAQSLLVYDAMQYAMNTGRKFDFEGSMIKGAAEFAFSFNPDTEIIYHIYSKSNKYLFLDAIRNINFLIMKEIKKKQFRRTEDEHL